VTSAYQPFTVVLATRNAGKIKEITNIFRDTSIIFKTAADFPGCPEVVEDGQTLEDNARKKAYVVAKFTKHIALADDSGLEVDFLDGAPGVISARFAGAHCTYADNNKKLLKALKGVPMPHRRARFRTVIALAVPGGATQTVEGQIDGFIAEQSRGTDGFGYDPVFLLPDQNKTLAELGLDAKNKVSHRFKAVQSIRPILLGLERNIREHKHQPPPFKPEII
jgi:XTP/dITP diphosphohydrolase